MKFTSSSFVFVSSKVPSLFTLPFMPFINKVVLSLKIVSTVFIINLSSSCPFSPDAEAVINPIGFFEKTVVETHHSIAFFKPLGILNTYSGVQIKIASVC